MLNSIIGAKPTQVPFNGGAPAMNALVGGQVDYMCADIITGGTHHEGKAIKVFGIAAPAPNPALPGVPTTAQGGLPEFQVSAWNGFLAPKGTPKPIIDRLADALDKALDDEPRASACWCSAATSPTSRSAARRRSWRWSRARSTAGRRSSRRPACR